MKKIIWVAVIVAVFVYGSGFVTLGTTGAMSYLNKWEEYSLNGDVDSICDLMHEDLEFSIDDRTTPGQPIDMQGGKTELCAYYTKVVPAMKHVVSGMNVTRENVTVERDWLLHPWTADVSYLEQRTVSMASIQMTLNTTGEDRLTLVRTLTDGVKIRRLHAKTRMTQPAT